MNIHRSSPCFANLKLGLVRRFSLNVSDQQKQNHYDSLGITPKATQGDIKTAYYKLSKEYHPDLNKGDETAAEKFRNITSAYEVLGNVKSRKVYDRSLLVGSYSSDYEVPADPPVDEYPHAPFYHHRNKPTSTRATMNTRHYNIDEWTQAHYSKTFEKSYVRKSEAHFYKRNTETDEKDLKRNIPTVSFVIIATLFLVTFGADRKFDKPSRINDKPD